jgi:hypothetical protein
MSNQLLDKKYYIVNTPVVDDTILYNYDKRDDGSKRTNQINASNSEIYYSDIISDPNLVTTQNGVPTANFDFGNAIYTSQGNQYSLSRGYNLYELLEQISKSLVGCISDIELLKECNTYSKSKKPVPPNCKTTFQGYENNKTIDNSKLPLYQYNIMNDRRKKHLYQQLNDLNNMINTYNIIIASVANDSTIPRSQYNELVRTNNINVKLRNDLDEKLGEIYEYNNSEIVRSRTNLDNTMYTGIMWGILATTLVVIIFAKM